MQTDITPQEKKPSRHSVVLQKAGDLLIVSRQSRLETEARNKRKNVFQKFFSTLLGRFALKPFIEMLPSPVGYGPGDLITGMSAVSGKDVLTGDHLDKVDRALYAIVTVIPFVPSIVLVLPIRILRQGIEEVFYSGKKGDLVGSIKSATDIKKTSREIISVIKKNK